MFVYFISDGTGENRCSLGTWSPRFFSKAMVRDGEMIHSWHHVVPFTRGNIHIEMSHLIGRKHEQRYQRRCIFLTTVHQMCNCEISKDNFLLNVFSISSPRIFQIIWAHWGIHFCTSSSGKMRTVNWIPLIHFNGFDRKLSGQFGEQNILMANIIVFLLDRQYDFVVQFFRRGLSVSRLCDDEFFIGSFFSDEFFVGWSCVDFYFRGWWFNDGVISDWLSIGDFSSVWWFIGHCFVTDFCINVPFAIVPTRLHNMDRRKCVADGKRRVVKAGKKKKRRKRREEKAEKKEKKRERKEKKKRKQRLSFSLSLWPHVVEEHRQPMKAGTEKERMTPFVQFARTS